MLLTVTCKQRDFFAYWYGVGTIVLVEPLAVSIDNPTMTFVVDYGDDTYRAQYQADRFASGLIFAALTEKEDS